MKKSALPRICITAAEESPEALGVCARSALQHSRLVELRLDWVADPRVALPVIPRLLRTWSLRQRGKPLVLQATCRRRENGGRFGGAVSEQLEILRRASALGCRLLDLEIESAEAAGREAVESLRQGAWLILSAHDFLRTPRLDAVASRLRRFPADFYKLATTANRQSDNCRALHFLRSTTAKEPNERWVCFCMGEAGIPSRVLALSQGSAFVYAAGPSPQEKSPLVPNGGNRPRALPEPAAPGQIRWEVLRNTYRAEKLGPQSALYGLLGNPVRHSLGAALHNAAFRSQAVDAVYLPLLSPDLNDLRSAVTRYPLAGFSVTIPYKQKILRWVDRLDGAAKAAGAANTVRVRRGRWEAINTDIEGIALPLRKAFRLRPGEFFPRAFRCLIVGAGGAARAAVAALRELRCRDISVTGRNPARVGAFTRAVGGQPIPVALLEREHFDLLIHATSVGMWPQWGDCFLRPEQLNAGIVFDLVYNPAETRLLQIARARGCGAISGLEMFLAQAARQFEYWTGLEAPRLRMWKTAQRELCRLRQLHQKSGPVA